MSAPPRLPPPLRCLVGLEDGDSTIEYCFTHSVHAVPESGDAATPQRHTVGEGTDETDSVADAFAELDMLGDDELDGDTLSDGVELAAAD